VEYLGERELRYSPTDQLPDALFTEAIIVVRKMICFLRGHQAQAKTK